MPLMCEDCFSQYNIKRRSGLYCKYCGGNLVEIDEIFIEAIILLNEKGYYTKYCCSGHPDPKGFHGAYISFYDGGCLPFLPDGWMYDKDRWTHIDFSKHLDSGLAIRIEFSDAEDLVELQREILQKAINVLDWAISLPDINDVEN